MASVQDSVCQEFTTRFALMTHSSLLYKPEQQFGRELTQETRIRYFKSNPERQKIGRDLSPMLRAEPVLWLDFYLQGILLAFIFSQIKTKQKESKIYLNLADGKMWLATAVWPAGLFLFKVTNPLKQAVQVIYRKLHANTIRTFCFRRTGKYCDVWQSNNN